MGNRNENNKIHLTNAPPPGRKEIYEIWTEEDEKQSPSAALSPNIEIYEILTAGDKSRSPSAGGKSRSPLAAGSSDPRI